MVYVGNFDTNLEYHFKLGFIITFMGKLDVDCFFLMVELDNFDIGLGVYFFMMIVVGNFSKNTIDK
jgi:hypothetical protein